MKLLVVTLLVSFGVNAAWAQGSTAESSTTVGSANTGTIAAPASLIEPIKKAKKWTGTAYYGIYNDVSAVNRGDQDAGNGGQGAMADAFVQVRRDIGNGQKLALRINAMYNQMDDSKQSEWEMYDTQFLYSFPIFASTLRLSIPTSKWGKEIGRHELRYNGGNDMLQAGKFTLSSIVEARAYAYTKEEDGQRSVRGRLGASGAYEVNKYFTPYLAGIYEVNKYYHGTGMNIVGNPTKDRQEKVDITYLDLGAEFNVIPKLLHINAYIEQARARSNSADQELFNEDQTAYNVEFTLSM